VGGCIRLTLARKVTVHLMLSKLAPIGYVYYITSIRQVIRPRINLSIGSRFKYRGWAGKSYLEIGECVEYRKCILGKKRY
jgi:hypothetical protein